MNDFEEKKFLNAEDAIRFISDRDNTDVWRDVIVSELKVCSVPTNAPILASTLVESLINFKGDEEKILETMDTQNGGMGLLLQGPDPEGDGFATLPLRFTAHSSLFERAGLGGRSIRNVDETERYKVLDPREKADILTKCLALYDQNAKMLWRDGKISTIRSDKYLVLKTGKLFETLTDSLKISFDDVAFVSCVASHEMTQIRLRIIDQGVEEKIRTYTGLADSGFGFDLITSDIGNSTAKIRPLLFYKGNFIPFGEGAGMKHSTGSSFDKWTNEILPKIGTLVKDMTEKIDALTILDIFNIGGSIRKLAQELKLPKEISKEVAEERENTFMTFNGLDLYDALFDIVTRYIDKNPGVSSIVKLKYFDQVANSVYMNYSDYDYAFEWA